MSFLPLSEFFNIHEKQADVRFFWKKRKGGREVEIHDTPFTVDIATERKLDCQYFGRHYLLYFIPKASKAGSILASCVSYTGCQKGGLILLYPEFAVN